MNGVENETLLVFLEPAVLGDGVDETRVIDVGIEARNSQREVHACTGSQCQHCINAEAIAQGRTRVGDNELQEVALNVLLGRA